MILDPLDIPDELLKTQEQGKLVVFAGAGIANKVGSGRSTRYRLKRSAES